MIDPPGRLEFLNTRTREVDQSRRAPDVCVARQILDVDGTDPTGNRHAEHLGNSELIVSKEFLLIAAVTEVAFAVAVDVQLSERRTMDSEVDAVVRESLENFATITRVDGPVVAALDVDYALLVNHVGNSIRLRGRYRERDKSP